MTYNELKDGTSMIRLMEIKEMDEVLALVDEKDVMELREVLPHLNVYVYDVDGIKGFTYIVDGYFIGDVIVPAGELEMYKALITHLQGRYDELLVHLDKDSNILETALKDLGFTIDEIDEELMENYNAFLYLS